MNGLEKDSPVTKLPHAEKRHSFWLVVNLSCRFLLAGIFLMAAIPKITNLQTFEDRILQDSALPDEVAWVVVRFLPWLELTCGLSLVLGYAVREAGLVVALLMVAFLIYSLFYRNGGDCGCFLFSTEAPMPRTWWHPVRNFLLFVSCIPVICGEKGWTRK